MTAEQRQLLTPEELAHYDDRECRDCDQAESVEFMADKLIEARAHIQALEEALLYCIDNIDGCIQGRDLPSTVIRDKARAALSPAPATTEPK